MSSVPSPYMQRHTSTTEANEDCRDYLRTGRCKYGHSCKYNHPENVQSGGGMKGPIDPTEPMFPVRLNEPVCQYYMKHGTCKFGQTCKFNHPPSSVAAASRINGNPMLMNKNESSCQVIWNPGSEMGAPLLPQRPDEPNCIYFLKNGRCKYGSTCRYHHPLNYHERKAALDDGRRHHLQVNQGHGGDNAMQPKLHYVSLPPGTYQQGHFVVADGQLAFLSLDGSSQGQVISVAPQSSGMNKDGTMAFSTSNAGKSSRPLSRDVVSSTSSTSIASSYETASGGSLNTFNVIEQSPHRSHIVNSGSRGAVIHNANEAVSNLPRVVSTSNTSDGSTVYYDANTGLGRQGQPPSQVGSGGNTGVSWKGQRSSSFDYSRQKIPNPHGQGEMRESASVPSFPIAQEDHQGLPKGQGFQHDSQRSPMTRGRPPPSGSLRTRRSMQTGVEVDDGLSMMTSALLTMLDTPEERAAEHYQDYNDPRGTSSESSTPLIGNQFSSRRDVHNSPMQNSYNIQAAQYMPQPGSYYDQNTIDDKSIGMPVHQSDDGHVYDRDEAFPSAYAHNQPRELSQEWSPMWQAQTHIDDSLKQSSQSMAQPPPNSSHDTSNVGLYLP